MTMTQICSSEALLTRAQKQDRKLERRIRRLIEAGRYYKAQQLTRLRARSFSLRAAAAEDARSRMNSRPRKRGGLHGHAKTRLSGDHALRIAQSENLWRCCSEAVRTKSIMKLNGAERIVFDFGPRHRTRQKAVVRLLRPFANLHPGQRAVIGGGREETSRMIVRALSQGYKFVVIVDIKNCFGSFDDFQVARLLPLPAAVIRHNIVPSATGGGKATPTNRVGHNNNKKLSVPLVGRSGIPQGSAASPLVCDMLLAQALQQLRGDIQVFTHLDDFAILARTRKEAVLSLKALRAALQQHPAGPLELKYSVIGRVADGFRYLGYVFSKRAGMPIAKPVQENLERFRETFADRIVQLANSGKGDRELRSYVRSWCRQFSEWPGHRLWLSMHLSRIERAVELYENQLDALIQQAMRKRSPEMTTG